MTGQSRKWHEETTQLDVAQIIATEAQSARRIQVLTVLSGHRLGQTLVVGGKSVTLGRERKCQMCLTESGVSRNHARIEHAEGDRLVISDLNSTNGTFLNGVKVREELLQDGDILHLGPVAVVGFGLYSDQEHRLRVKQYDLSTKDELTGIHNRRFLDQALSTELAYAVRYQDPLSMLLFDIDHFKQVNDRFGHHIGDRVLHDMAQAISDQLRTEDIFARYGGEEFAVVLRGHDGEHAYQCAERVRKAVAAMTITDVEGIHLTVSVGIATFDGGPPPRAEQLTTLADQHLYQAKDAGRNRSCA